MPRERVQHGKLYVIEAKGSTKVTDLRGEETGAVASLMHEYAPGEELHEGDIIQEQPSVDVTWNRDPGYVQISIEAPADYWERFEKGRKDGGQTHYGIFSETLTRQEINHLIRTLRRARDAAFGADE